MNALLPLLKPIAIGVAILAAAVMGFAIQRGATCMVAAVSEVHTKRRFNRALALLETSLWVAGLLAAVRLAGLAMPPDQNYPASATALLGGLALGVGALVNGACVFGSIARFGSGNWHYILSPVGFYFGSLLHSGLGFTAAQGSAHSNSSTGAWVALAIFIPLLAYRTSELAAAACKRQFAAKLWLAHHATIVIGVAFVILLLAAGPWTYTQVLNRLTHGGMSFSVLNATLFAALLGGAVIGGVGRRERVSWNGRTALSCLAGGGLMGFGSALIPGGNDNLILVGMPAPHSYAWLAIAAMAAAIWIGLIIKEKARRLPPDSVGGSLPAG